MASAGKAGSPKNEPIWEVSAKLPTFPSLEESLEADVCIVGAGISGLSAAYFLTQEGQSVVVLDEGEVAGGMTGVTTAHLANAIDDRYLEIERLHGEEGARLAAESHTAAIDRIESVVEKEGISCGFERLDGYLFLPPDGKEELLGRELEAVRRAGLAEVSKLDRLPLPSLSPGPCLRFPNQGQFHPLKYLAGLVKAIERDGGRIFTHSRAEEIEGGASARVACGRHRVTAQAVVVATSSPVNDRFVLHTKQAPYTTYAIAGRVPHGSVPRALYWDTLDPYHYIRLLPGAGAAKGKSDVLIVGGEDHKTGQADDGAERYACLEAWARERLPVLAKIERTWSGQVMETVDGLAFLGRNPLDANNVFVATGDSGMGMTHGTIAGILLTDLIVGRENPWSALYDPSRKTLGAAKNFLDENLNVAAQYADWLTGGDLESEEQIAKDSGAVLRTGVAKIAVYRDEEGKLHRRSAVCPHLGCIVHWNSNDKTWDCPCHGSRFDKLGKVVNGPAFKDLQPLEG